MEEILIFEGLRALAGVRAEVGALDARNASLFQLHASGSPARGIPARPALLAAMEGAGVHETVAAMFADAAICAIEGNQGGADGALEAAGAFLESAAKAGFSEGLAPNKPSTVKAKGGNTPLIETGSLRASITHRIVRG